MMFLQIIKENTELMHLLLIIQMSYTHIRITDINDEDTLNKI